MAAWLRRQVAQVLEVPEARVQPDRSLLSLGLDSLAAAELAGAIDSGLGVQVPLASLLAGPSVAELAQEIGQRVGQGAPLPAAGAAPAAAPAPPHPGHPWRYPLSWGQRALWLLDRLAPGCAAYVIAGAARVRGRLDVTALRQALLALVERHPSLRTTFEATGEDCVQVVHAEAVLGFADEDATGWTDAQLEERLVEEAHRPFDLAGGPLLRVTLFHRRQRGRRLPEECLVVLAVHHIVADFGSLGVLLGELGALYRGESLPPLAGSHADFVRRQAQRLAGAEGERLESYWLGALAPGTPPIDLPTDRPRPPLQTFRGGARALWLDRELTAGLKARGDRAGATAFMTLLAVFLVLLHRHGGQDELLVGTPTAGRSPELAGLVGYFVNPVVIHGDLAGDPTFDELLGRVRETALAAFAHQDYPFPLLAERLGGARDPGRSPIFQVMFALYRERRRRESGLGSFALGRGGATLDLGGLGLESVPLPRRSAQFELTLLMAEAGGALAGALQFNSDLFDAATAGRMATQLQTLAGALAAPRGRAAGGGPPLGIGALPLLAAGERHQLIVEWSGAAPPPPVLRGLHRWFEAAVERAPQAVAVVCEGASLTYGELNRRANRLARHLRRLGVAPEDRVALCLERSLGLVIGVLGILKAGGAYVPLDPSYPRDRLRFIAGDALAGTGRPVLVTERRLAGLFELDAAAAGGDLRQLPRLVLLDAEQAAIARESDLDLAGDAALWALAYVIYTSGSTGQPKGVMVAHANVERLFQATRRWFGFGSRDIWTLFHSAAFDFSVWELWGALLHGGRLVVVPYWVSRTPEAFHRLLAAEAVTVLNQTPSAFRLLDEADARAAATARQPGGARRAALPGLALRLVIFGGEAVDLAALAPWMERRGDARPRLVNMYGITETTVHVTCRPLAAADLDAPQRSPIGTGIPDLRLYLLDARSRPVPLGVAGEIHVAGAGVARGYLGRPELTAARFLPDPFGQAPGGRLYRSGDLARWRGDGGLDFLGRVDLQIKIRGFRIELGEIEAALQAHPAVAAAAVALRSPAAEEASGGGGAGGGGAGDNGGSGAGGCGAGDNGGAGVERRLVAYVVARGGPPGGPGDAGNAGRPLSAVDPGRPSSAGELRQALAARLPDYMVPAVFVFLPRLPLTPSGKLDRRALPPPGPPGPDAMLAGLAGAAGLPAAAPGSGAPRTPVEELLAGLWAEVLGVEAVGMEDDFFRLGGHSLLAVRVAARLRDLLGVELSISRLFELSRLSALAREVETAIGAGGPRPAPIRRLPGETRESVLSFAQERLWFLDRLEPGRPTYNLPGALRLVGPLHVAALARGLAEIRRRHQVLRTVFVERAGGPIAVLAGAPAATAAAPPAASPATTLPLVDLTRLQAERREAEADGLRRAEARRPFDLAAGPLLRAALLRLAGPDGVRGAPADAREEPAGDREIPGAAPGGLP
ncbi:MAG TPA: amino acid adenylation domain-containing protein, partial [Thermoanaerobaculia bacterium]|nr:amino acid adenylation domain-containing protein [Thermoanaerobaculia bacterium]